MTVDDLKKIYGVFEDQELAPIFGKTKAAVSSWRKKGVPAAIELVAGQKAEADGSPSRYIRNEDNIEISPSIDMTGFSREVRTVAEYLEVKLKGKSEMEKEKIVDDLLDQVRELTRRA